MYATFSSYDEVAHHSGLERADTLEALRKLDQQFGRIDRARRYAPRPYEIVVLSDHGQTQGATFKQRNGYGLDDLVRRSLEAGRRRPRSPAATSRTRWSGTRVGEATGRTRRRRSARRTTSRGQRRRRARLGQPRPDLPDGGAAAADARGDRASATRGLIPALREHPHVGWLLVRSAEHGAARARRRAASRYLADGRGRGRGPARAVLAERAAHLLRTDGFAHVADIMVGSFYDPRARRGLRVRGADLVPRRPRRPPDAAVHPHPATLPVPDEPIVGAAAVHALLSGWRRQLQPDAAARPGAARVHA